MSVKKRIAERRTIRKFSQNKIPEDLLVSYIELAGLAPSGANLQPLKYVLIQSAELTNAVFEYVKWAGYLNGAHTPLDDERPVAYIAIMHDKNISSTMTEFDAGAAAMSIILAAEEDGIGCCIMGAIDRENICRIMKTPENLNLMYILALGYKKEHPVCTEMLDGNVKYYLSNGIITVPKRKISDILTKI